MAETSEGPAESATNGPPSQAITAKGTTEVVEMSPLQQSTARSLAESKAIAPHAYFSLDADMRAGARLIEGKDEGPGLLDLLIRAGALALKRAPQLNAAYRDGHLERYSRINVGFAVAARETTALPVIHDADSKPLAAIAAERSELAARAKDGSITRPELAGATFTVIAMPGVGRMTPVITRGQAATLAVGALHQAVLAAQGEAIVAPRLSLTLACDARIVQSAEGADFLVGVRALLEDAEEI